MKQDRNSTPFSRRSFLHLSAAASTVAAMHIVTEPMLAHAAAKNRPLNAVKGAVMINANENPLGPCIAAREAISSMAALGGRYSTEMTDDLVQLVAKVEGLKPNYIQLYPGSSGPLHHSVLSYTSPSKSYVTADPGYEAGMEAAKITGARVVKVPLTKSYSHDVKAMVAAAPDAGMFYICTPNNPTGTLTSHADIEYVVENKPKGAVVVVDEAYLHFCDAPSALDLVKAGKDVVVLRTFSKIYGMAGIRCGMAFARPDLLEKISGFSGWNAMPITAVAAATASLNAPHLLPERKAVNAKIRGEVFEWLDRNAYSYVPSHSNCFMLDTKRPAKQVIDAMAAEGVMIGRIWPAWPTHARITVGTSAEMDRFQEAFKKVMSGTVSRAWAEPNVVAKNAKRNFDGLVLPA